MARDVSWQTFLWRSVLLGFFPRGYPESVAGPYLPYVSWTAVGLLAGRMQAVLATQAALFAAGLSAGAIPMAVAVQWVLKDGVGHAGAIVYAASVNTRFDADAKRYRFHSTLALTAADVIAVLMPLAPQHFFVLASLSSTTSSIANLAQVAARARIMSSFAVQGNLADCVRAGQTQAKLMSLIGTGAGAGLSWYLGPEPLHVLAAMAPLAAVSLYAMYESSRLVVLRTLNVQRAERVYSELLEQLSTAPPHVDPRGQQTPISDADTGAAGRLWAASPEDIAQAETFVLPYTSVVAGELWLQPLFPSAAASATLLRLGVRRDEKADGGGSGARTDLGAALPALQSSLPQRGVVDVSGAAALGADGDMGDFDEAASSPFGDVADYSAWRAAWCDGYAIAACAAGGDTVRVALWYRADMQPESKMRAVWHATMLRSRLSSAGLRTDGATTSQIIRDALEATTSTAHATWPQVYAALEHAGWDLRSAYLDGEAGSLEIGRSGDGGSAETQHNQRRR